MRTFVLITLLLTACASESGSEQSEQGQPSEEAATPQEAATPALDPRDVEFAPELGVNLDAMTVSESGLYVQVLREGDGPAAAAGDTMGVEYALWLPDGTKVDASADHEPPAPLPMVLGRTALIAGWTEGVTGMRLGERRRLVLPYELAYGAAGRPPRIPEYSTLVFEVELAQHAPIGGE
jgi:peptidylprolyl isomerase